MMKLSLKERRERFIFFLCIFLVAASILSVAVFYNYGDSSDISKADFAKRVQDENYFEKSVEEATPTIDTTYSRIAKFNPNVQAVFLENDIMNAITAIRSYSSGHPYDSRYKCFIYASKINQAMFYDRRELRGNYNDIASITKSLNTCFTTSQQLQQSLNSQPRR